MNHSPVLAFTALTALLASCGGGASSSSESLSVHEHDYELVVTKDPDWKTYLAGSDFDPSGMEVALRCKSCEESTPVEFTLSNDKSLTLDQTSVHITYQDYELDYPIKVKEKFHLACVGDSLTKGHMWPNQSYPSYLSSKVDERFEVGNFGENGISITGYGGSWDNPDMRYIKQHFYEDSLAFAPDIIALMLGTNDATNWASAEASFLSEYHILLDAYLEAFPGVKILMMVSPPTKDGNQFGIPNGTIKEQVNPIQRQLAQEYGFSVLDLREEFEAKEDYESAYLRPWDGVHFTTEAADYVAGRVWDIAKTLKF